MKIKLYKLFSIVVLLLMGAVVYFNQAWFLKQYDKMCSMYYIHKGDKAFRKLKLQRAIDHYNTALKLFPEHYSAWFNLGNIYVVYEDYYSAVDAYEQFLAEMNKQGLKEVRHGEFGADMQLALVNEGPCTIVMDTDEWQNRRSAACGG